MRDSGLRGIYERNPMSCRGFRVAGGFPVAEDLDQKSNELRGILSGAGIPTEMVRLAGGFGLRA